MTPASSIKQPIYSMTKFMLLGLFVAKSVHAQIALDNSIPVGIQTGSSETLAYTVSGSDTFLIVGISVQGGATCTGVFYSGIPMTQAGAPVLYSAINEYEYTYILLGPSSGTHNILATFSGSAVNAITAASYTGVAAVDTTNITSSTSARDWSGTITTAVDGEWIVGYARASGPMTARDNTIIRQDPVSENIIDSNGAVFSLGSNSIGVHQGSIDFMYIGAVALKPGVQSGGQSGWNYGDGRHGSYTLTTSMTIEQLYQAVRLPTDPAQYNPSDPGAVPNFANFTVANNSTLSASAWNGTVGGTIVFKTQFTLQVVAGASISVNGLGYGGGATFQAGDAPPGSGGGGSGGVVVKNGRFTNYTPGGGGGGYGSPGGNGIYVLFNGGPTGGWGGNAYGNEVLDALLLGSGGGGGASGDPVLRPEDGGSGGGAIALSAARIILNGTIQANGGGGGYTSNSLFQSNGGAGGGGGSGGSVLIRTNSAALGVNNLSASGGVGGYLGGTGGDGRIRINFSASTTGTTSPAASFFNDNTNDVDGDGVPDAVEWGPDLDHPKDTDHDGIPDFMDSDSDNNGIPDSVQLGPDGLDRTQDTDGDGIPNYWETFYGLDPNNPADAATHPPGEQLTYLQKFQHKLNPLTTDTNGDGLSDYDAIFTYGTNPLLTDTDGDGISDKWAVDHGFNPLVNNASGDPDNDGLTNLQEFQNNTNPLQWSTAVNGHSDLFNVSGKRRTVYHYDKDNRLVSVEYDNGLTLNYSHDANSNLIGQSFSMATQAPSFITNPQGQSMFTGQSVAYTAFATGIPVPTYQWQRLSAGATSWSNITSAGGFSGATTQTLTIASVNTAMSGDQFRSVATNGANPDAISAVATLSVAVPNYADWAGSLGLAGANAGFGAKSLPQSDLPNLARYSMGLGPSPGATQIPSTYITVVNGQKYLNYEFRQRKNLNGVQVVVQSSTDAMAWQSDVNITIVRLADDDSDTARYQASVPIPSNSLIFLRVRTIPPP